MTDGSGIEPAYTGFVYVPAAKEAAVCARDNNVASRADLEINVP
jgi:hypothetical protein